MKRVILFLILFIFLFTNSVVSASSYAYEYDTDAEDFDTAHPFIGYCGCSYSEDSDYYDPVECSNITWSDYDFRCSGGEWTSDGKCFLCDAVCARYGRTNNAGSFWSHYYDGDNPNKLPVYDKSKGNKNDFYADRDKIKAQYDCKTKSSGNGNGGSNNGGGGSKPTNCPTDYNEADCRTVQGEWDGSCCKLKKRCYYYYKGGNSASGTTLVYSETSPCENDGIDYSTCEIATDVSEEYCKEQSGKEVRIDGEVKEVGRIEYKARKTETRQYVSVIFTKEELIKLNTVEKEYYYVKVEGSTKEIENPGSDFDNGIYTIKGGLMSKVFATKGVYPKPEEVFFCVTNDDRIIVAGSEGELTNCKDGKKEHFYDYSKGPGGYEILDPNTEPMNCEEILGKNTGAKIIKGAITVVQVLSAIVAVVNGMIILLPAVTKGDADALKASSKKLVWLGVVLLLILVLRPVIRLIGTIFEFDTTCIL